MMVESLAVILKPKCLQSIKTGHVTLTEFLLYVTFSSYISFMQNFTPSATCLLHL